MVCRVWRFRYAMSADEKSQRSGRRRTRQGGGAGIYLYWSSWPPAPPISGVHVGSTGSPYEWQARRRRSHSNELLAACAELPRPGWALGRLRGFPRARPACPWWLGSSSALLELAHDIGIGARESRYTEYRARRICHPKTEGEIGTSCQNFVRVGCMPRMIGLDTSGSRMMRWSDYEVLRTPYYACALAPLAAPFSCSLPTCTSDTGVTTPAIGGALFARRLPPLSKCFTFAPAASLNSDDS